VSRFAPEGAEDVCRRLRGTTILRIGGTDDDVKIEDGGPLIDYKTVGDRIVRLILGFNENGIWMGMIHWRQSGRISKITDRRTPGRSLKMNLRSGSS
jgi:hypothetical protein